jgi:hypothetical protein
MLARVSLLIALVFVCGAAPGDYSLIGVGLNSCGTWTSDRAGQNAYPKLADEQWVVGYLSGMGFEGGGKDNPLNGVDAEAVWAWIDNYCHANPLDHIAKAAEAFSYAHPR